MPREKYSPQDIAFITKNYLSMTMREIGLHLRKSYRCISEKLSRLGLRGEKKKIIQKKKPLHSYRAYVSWGSMIQRCTNKKSESWIRYGGRGISIHPRWREFNNFLQDMGERPPGFSIDRINPNGNYDPGNCRWIPMSEQGSTTEKVVFQKPCIACNRRSGNHGGRCHRCNEYFRRNGSERPVCDGRISVKVKMLVSCSNCKVPAKPITHGRCSLCDKYIKYNGKERPSRLWSRKSPIIERGVSVPFREWMAQRRGL